MSENLFIQHVTSICCNDPAKQKVDWSKVTSSKDSCKSSKCSHLLPCGLCDITNNVCKLVKFKSNKGTVVTHK